MSAHNHLSTTLRSEGSLVVPQYQGIKGESQDLGCVQAGHLINGYDVKIPGPRAKSGSPEHAVEDQGAFYGVDTQTASLQCRGQSLALILAEAFSDGSPS